jgi:RHS repeat-associated protein
MMQSGTGSTALACFVYDSQGRLMGEYLASATDVKGEYIYLSPDGANDNQSPFGGDDGMGGYGLLAVATKDAGNNPVIHWIHSNHLGAPMVTTDNSGIGIAPGSYTQAVFPGQMRTHADLYYNRYRDYDPTTGRYIQADPIGLAGGSNPYLYANDNPMRYTDPTGEFVPLLVIGGRLALQCAVNPACRTAVVAGGAAAAAAIYNWSNNSPLNPALGTPFGPIGGGLICFGNARSGGGFGNPSSSDDDPDGACEIQKEIDELECNQWNITGNRDGYSRTEGYAICMRTVATRYAECRSRGMNPNRISTNLFLPTSRRGIPDPGRF